MQIPKVIHYCWFGRNPLPESAVKCIESWKKYLPDYEIREWNEDNFDVNAIPYTRQAYERKKYAFVSDYARFYILYRFGGVYFDTDVEVIRSFEPILERGAFMGCERDGGGESGIAVNAGLGIAAAPGMALYREILARYEALHFINEDGSNNITTVVDHVTAVLKEQGLKDIPGIQMVADTVIYPKEYFCPKVMDTDDIFTTENTYSIHHYDASWAEELDRRSGRRAVKLKKVFGEKLGGTINVVIYGWQKYGVIGSIRRAARRKK